MLKAILIVVSMASTYSSAEHRGAMGGGYGAGMGQGGMGMGQGPYGMGQGGMGMGGMGMGQGGMGMGGGGGGASPPESKFKPETLEQPAKEAREKIQKLTESTIAANQKAAQAFGESLKSLEQKDTPLDKGTVEQLSFVGSAADSKAAAESMKDMLEQINRSGETTAKLAAEQAKAQVKALQAGNDPLEEDASATLLNLGKKIESFAGLASGGRSPASTTPQAEAMGARGFAGVHNPPSGL